MVKTIKFDDQADPDVFQRLYVLIEKWSNNHATIPGTWEELVKEFDDANILFESRDLYNDNDKVEIFHIPKDKPHLAIPHKDDLVKKSGLGKYDFPFFFDDAYIAPGPRSPDVVLDKFRRNRVAEYCCKKCS